MVISVINVDIYKLDDKALLMTWGPVFVYFSSYSSLKYGYKRHKDIIELFQTHKHQPGYGGRMKELFNIFQIRESLISENYTN